MLYLRTEERDGWYAGGHHSPNRRHYYKSATTQPHQRPKTRLSKGQLPPRDLKKKNNDNENVNVGSAVEGGANRRLGRDSPDYVQVEVCRLNHLGLCRAAE